MGATIVTSKAVGGFRNPETDEVIYVLFEETYDKRTHPHLPSWECRAVGTFDQVFKEVFAAAAACEGGGLQTRSGTTKPETYLKSWRACFSEPFQMDDLDIELKLGGDAFDDPIPDTHIETAMATLERIGRTDVLAALRAGPVTISLHRDVDVITALYGVDTRLPIWKVVRNKNRLGYADATLAPTLLKRNVATPSVTAFALDAENVLVSIDGGPLKNMGWRYSAVGQYMRDVVYAIEMQSSLSAYKLIRQFREACDNALELSGDTIISVSPANTSAKHCADSAKKLAVKLGLCPSAETVSDKYETTLLSVRTCEQTYLLSLLDEAQVTWTVPVGNSNSRADHRFLSTQQNLF